MIVGVYTVTCDDFRNTRRSYIVLGVIGVFAGLVGMVFVFEMNIYDNPYRALFDVAALIGFVFPLFVAPLTYLSIAGDVSRGSIKYVLGLPNSRLEYFVGKYASRAAVAVAAVVLGTLVGFVVAAATFTNSAALGRFLMFAGVSMVYAVALSGLFVSISAMTASRSRAMFAVLVMYFVLMVFWPGLLPFLNLQMVIDTIASTLGIAVSAPTRELISMLSPVNAYHQTTGVVFSGVLDQHPGGGPQSDWLASQTWFCLLVELGWATLVPAIGYLKFRGSELG